MKRLTLLFALALAAALPLGALACQREETRNEAPAVDVALMAFLSQARAAHHEANVREQENDIAGAIRPLDRLTGATRPAGNRPEVNEVLADTHARIAELRTKSGDLIGAGRDIEAGLALAPARTYFRGHLLEVSGVVEETRASTLADGGKPEEAARARAKAVELLREAVLIQEEVIRATLTDGGREGQR